MRRVLVVGITGAGKTSAARRLAAALEVAFHEMDALALGPNWMTPATFVADVAGIVRTEGWVFDSYGYEQVRADMWAHADTVVWLDYPARVVLPRVLRRSLVRSAQRTPVFGGNIETWRSWLSAEHPVWWSMRQLRARRRAIADLTRQPRPTPLSVLRFRRPAEFARWFARTFP